MVILGPMPIELLQEDPSATTFTVQVCPQGMLVMSHPVALVLQVNVCLLEHSKVVIKETDPLLRDQDTLAVLLPQFVTDWIFCGGQGPKGQKNMSFM